MSNSWNGSRLDNPIGRRPFIFAAGALGLCALAPSPVLAEGVGAKIVLVRGDATVLHDGKDVEAKAGMDLGSGDAIVTKPGARLKLSVAETLGVTMSENTRIVLALRDVDRPGFAAKARLETGLVRLEQSDLDAGNRFFLQSVNTHTWALIPNSTWYVSSKPGGSRVAVTSGAIELSHDRQFWRLKLGQGSGMPRVPAKDVLKNRMPRASRFSPALLDRMAEQTAV